jgi:hypothetical protein
MATAKSMTEMADELEHKQMEDLIVTRSVLFNLADGKREFSMGDGKHKVLMGEDPRLPKMPDKPTILDFFKYRFAPTSNHLLQSAALARKSGCDEKLVLACLLHDIAVVGYIRSDHGYWGAQLIEPYVDEEVSWAIRHHQALRFYPDESVGYAYPDTYVKLFGEDYEPDQYIKDAYAYARNHKWYMTARLICVNDLYSFDPNAVVTLEEFEDVVGRHFKQPKEGLGYDNSPVAHMWRTWIRPANAL